MMKRCWTGLWIRCCLRCCGRVRWSPGWWTTRVSRRRASIPWESTRQYCGQVGKQDNCRVAVSLSVTTEAASMPIAFRLLPSGSVGERSNSGGRKPAFRKRSEFETKPQIALDEIKRARERGVPTGVVLADAGYGNDSQFRAQLTEWKMTLCRRAHEYGDGMEARRTAVAGAEAERHGASAETPAARSETSAGNSERRWRCHCQPDAWKTVSWRQGVKEKLDFALRRCSCAARSSRLLARGAACGRMASDRMAEGGERAHQILVFDAAAGHAADRTGSPCQTSLDHRTRL